MAKYTIISDIGKGILDLLRDKLVPEPVDSAEKIGICEPKERGGYIVGIHPYDIREDLSGTAKDAKTLPDGSQQDPPAMIELYYVISVSSKAEVESKALDEAKIIGKIIQVIKDNPVIPARYMPNNIGMPVENVPISMLPLNMEEKVKVWTMFGESYKLSVFYVVGPIALDSENIHKPKKRVETVHLNTNQYVYKQKLQFDTHIKEEDIDDEWTQRPDEDEDEEDSFGDDFGSDEDSGDEFGGDEDSGDEFGSDEAAEDSSDELGEGGETEVSEDDLTGDENFESGADESADNLGEDAEAEEGASDIGGDEAAEESMDEPEE